MGPANPLLLTRMSSLPHSFLIWERAEAMAPRS
jgi:hypothetical protein